MKQVILSIIIIVLFLGCANNIKYVQNIEDVTKEEPRIINYTLSDINNGTDSKESLVYNFEYDEIRHSTLVKEKYSVNVRQYTPYEGAREVYEVPLGILGIPVVIVGNIFDFALFGAIPNELLNDLFYSTFAGLNPFMNVESEKRSIFVEDSRSLTKTDKEAITKVIPLSGKTLNVCVNNTQAYNIVTDELGKSNIDMFDILSKERLAEEPRKITIYPAAENARNDSEKASCENPGKTNLTKYFARNRAFSLYDANKYLNYLNVLDNQDSAETAKSIIYLSNLGFEEWSMRAEDEIRKHYKDNNEFLEEFSKELRKLISRPEESDNNIASKTIENTPVGTNESAAISNDNGTSEQPASAVQPPQLQAPEVSLQTQ